MSQPAQRLTSSSFVGYLLMTFLTAVNDSMFRWLISPVGMHKLKGQSWNILGQTFKLDDLVMPLGEVPFAFGDIGIAGRVECLELLVELDPVVE